MLYNFYFIYDHSLLFYNKKIFLFFEFEKEKKKLDYDRHNCKA